MVLLISLQFACCECGPIAMNRQIYPEIALQGIRFNILGHDQTV
jgi:hypothetical protein